MRGAFTLGHIRGIPVRLHWTLLLILPYLAYLMSARFSAVTRLAGLSGRTLVIPPVAWGLLLAVLLFACVLAHELGHSLLALRFGGRVSAITLMLLGGLSELAGLPKTPRVEGLVAVVGPLVSLGIGVVSWALYRMVPGPPDLLFGLWYLAQINIVLAIFNLLPAFPMDGGRVLRALLATRLSRVRATRVAAISGALFAAAFVVLGLLSGNLLLALIGLFVWAGARAEETQVRQEQQLSGLRVRDLMSWVRETVHPDEPVSAAASAMARSHVSAVAVVEDGRLVGVVAAHRVEALSPAERERMPVGAVLQKDVPRLDADEALTAALERMAEHRTEEAPVEEHHEVVGVLVASDLARALRLRRLADEPPRRMPFRPPAPQSDQPGLQAARLRERALVGDAREDPYDSG